MRYQPVPTVFACAVATGVPDMVITKAFAVNYLSAAEAQRTTFPGTTGFELVPLMLSADQFRQLAEHTGGPARPGAWYVWQARQGDKTFGYFVTDAIISKFELINYAVAPNTAGEISGAEILTYRESHDYEARNKPWRAQLLSKPTNSALCVGDDINNASGVTLLRTYLIDDARCIVVMTRLALIQR